MKSITLIPILFLAFLISCQINAQTANSTTVVENENKSAETQFNALLNDSAVGDEANSNIGTIQSGKQSVCFRIQNPNLKIGEKVQIIITQLPQKSVEAEISEKSSCQEGFGVLDKGDITDYILKSSNKEFLSLGFGVGIVTAKKTQVKGRFATIDIDDDKKPVYFRECTSMEGLHLTVWKGKPLVGKGLWHAYYGLGYDTVPTCKKKDFYGSDD